MTLWLRRSGKGDYYAGYPTGRRVDRSGRTRGQTTRNCRRGRGCAESQPDLRLWTPGQRADLQHQNRGPPTGACCRAARIRRAAYGSAESELRRWLADAETARARFGSAKPMDAGRPASWTWTASVG